MTNLEVSLDMHPQVVQAIRSVRAELAMILLGIHMFGVHVTLAVPSICEQMMAEAAHVLGQVPDAYWQRTLQIQGKQSEMTTLRFWHTKKWDDFTVSILSPTNRTESNLRKSNNHV